MLHREKAQLLICKIDVAKGLRLFCNTKHNLWTRVVLFLEQKRPFFSLKYNTLFKQQGRLCKVLPGPIDITMYWDPQTNILCLWAASYIWNLTNTLTACYEFGFNDPNFLTLIGYKLVPSTKWLLSICASDRSVFNKLRQDIKSPQYCDLYACLLSAASVLHNL